ncbi:hypothetical protein D049_0417B, partial [Vibrio parahaemolyticus VPTS-2010]
ITARA